MGLGFRIALFLSAFAALPARAENCNIAAGGFNGTEFSVLFCEGPTTKPGTCAQNMISTNCERVGVPECQLGTPDNNYDAHCASISSVSAPPPNPATTTEPTVTQNPTVDPVIKKHVEIAVDDIQKRGTDADGTASSSFKSADEVNSIGMNQAATIGLLLCANGSVEQLNGHAEEATRNFGSCKQSFAAAKAIQTVSNGQPLKADASTLGEPGARETLEKFEKHFGISGDDYTRKMLEGGGSLQALTDLTSAKLPAEALAEKFNSSSAREETFEVNLAVAKTTKKGMDGLRDKLRKNIAAKEEPRAARLPSSDAKTPEPKPLKNLEPLRGGFFADPSEKKDEEISLFGVVHRKYLELTKKLHY